MTAQNEKQKVGLKQKSFCILKQPSVLGKALLTLSTHARLWAVQRVKSKLRSLWLLSSCDLYLLVSLYFSGISLSWNIPGESAADLNLRLIAFYEIFFCPDSDETTSGSKVWKKVGVVAAMQLPMSCNMKYLRPAGKRDGFAVRAIDRHGGIGPFSILCWVKFQNTEPRKVYLSHPKHFELVSKVQLFGTKI